MTRRVAVVYTGPLTRRNPENCGMQLLLYTARFGSVLVAESNFD